MPLSLEFLPKPVRGTVQALLVAGAIVTGTVGATSWLETKAKNAAEESVSRIEGKLDRVGCLVEAHVKGGKPEDYIKCELRP